MKKRYFATALLTLLASFTLASCDDFTLFGSSTTTIMPSKTSIPGSISSEDSSKNPDAFERVENTLTYNELSYSNRGSALQPPPLERLDGRGVCRQPLYGGRRQRPGHGTPHVVRTLEPRRLVPRRRLAHALGAGRESAGPTL